MRRSFRFANRRAGFAVSNPGITRARACVYRLHRFDKMDAFDARGKRIPRRTLKHIISPSTKLAKRHHDRSRNKGGPSRGGGEGGRRILDYIDTRARRMFEESGSSVNLRVGGPKFDTRLEFELELRNSSLPRV